MYKCPKCGNMSNHGKFCRYCGAKMNERVLTFENTNTLLRSNVFIKDNIAAHKDDVMDETERNVPLEIHDKDKDSSIDNNIYSFSNDINKDHYEDYDGRSFRNCNNGSQPSTDTNDEEPSFGFGENETFKTENYISSNYCADESVSEPFDTTEQIEEEVQEFNTDTYDGNETRGATEKNSNLPLDVAEKDQYSDLSDKNSSNNIAEKEDSIVVSSGTGYIDSMFGELPTFDTELIKKNYEQSLINRNKTEKIKHKFFGKKKTEW